MTDSITPPPEMVQQWFEQWEAISLFNDPVSLPNYIAARAAQWGADQELEACCKWLLCEAGDAVTEFIPGDLRAARRPKPQTLNSIALEMLGTIEKMDVVIPEITDTIRRALEQLDD